MSSSIRFLGVAVLAWAGVRAVSLGMFPGLTASLAPPVEAATTRLPPIEETHFTPPPPPLDRPMAMTNPAYGAYPAYPPYGAYPQPVAVPYYYPVPARAPMAARSRPSAWDEVAPSPRPLYDGWAVAEPVPMTQLASTAAGVRVVPPAAGVPGPAAARPVRRLDRLQLTAWALLRGSWGPGALAPGGTLGGSQAGARLTYNFSRSLSASLRSSSSIGGVRYAEVAAGVRWKPLASVPIALNFERRQALNRWGGRSAFALFAEGGLYQRPVFGIGNLDLYAQGGVVGFKSRDYFLDGAATVTRPVWRNFSAGIGVWGGMQPGLYRVDAGPRLTMDVGRGIRVHADYRQRLAGEAMPASGPALTIASDW